MIISLHTKIDKNTQAYACLAHARETLDSRHHHLGKSFHLSFSSCLSLAHSTGSFPYALLKHLAKYEGELKPTA